jgi:hypothetical protein
MREMNESDSKLMPAGDILNDTHNADQNLLLEQSERVLSSE